MFYLFYMTQEEAANKIYNYLDEQNIVFRGLKAIYLQVFAQLYAMGFDEGRQQTAHRKKVLQMDKFGNVIREYNSAMEAARAVDVDKTAISKACLGKTNSVKGFFWKYD